MALGRVVRGMGTTRTDERHLYDSLAIRSPDEPATVYGLLAECIAVAPDGAWIEFRLRDGATWHDGEPIDAADLTFSFGVFKEKANPSIAAAAVPFSGVEVIGANRVRYHVLPEHRHNRLLPIRLGRGADPARTLLDRPPATIRARPPCVPRSGPAPTASRTTTSGAGSSGGATRNTGGATCR